MSEKEREGGKEGGRERETKLNYGVDLRPLRVASCFEISGVNPSGLGQTQQNSGGAEHS